MRKTENYNLNKSDGLQVDFYENMEIIDAELKRLDDKIGQMAGETEAGNNKFPAPDYSNEETINRIGTNGGAWTADRNGYVHWKIGCNGTAGTTVRVNINGMDKILHYNMWQTDGIVTVKQGDVVKLIADERFAFCTCFFIPIKWA